MPAMGKVDRVSMEGVEVGGATSLQPWQEGMRTSGPRKAGYLGLGAEVHPVPPPVLRGVEELVLQEEGAPGPPPLHLHQQAHGLPPGRGGWVS